MNNSVHEFVNEKDLITPEDLQQISAAIQPGAECVINFPEATGEMQNFVQLKKSFDPIVEKAKRIVLIADPSFNVLLDGHSIAKVQFIDKPAFCYSKVEGTEFDEVFVSMIEKFWEHYFKEIKRIEKFSDNSLRSSFRAKAAVTLVKTGSPYSLVMRMDDNSLKMATEKILQISMQDVNYPQGAMVAEILNIICGHLKPVLRKKNFEVQVQIGIPEEIQESEKPHEEPDIFHWFFEIGPNSQFEISFYKEL